MRNLYSRKSATNGIRIEILRFSLEWEVHTAPCFASWRPVQGILNKRWVTDNYNYPILRCLSRDRCERCRERIGLRVLGLNDFQRSGHEPSMDRRLQVKGYRKIYLPISYLARFVPRAKPDQRQVSAPSIHFKKIDAHGSPFQISTQFALHPVIGARIGHHAHSYVFSLVKLVVRLKNVNAIL